MLLIKSFYNHLSTFNQLVIANRLRQERHQLGVLAFTGSIWLKFRSPLSTLQRQSLIFYLSLHI
jgi:hypothetical protein